MKPKYEMHDLRHLKVADLEPHPDVQLPIDDEDREALSSDIAENTVLQPLVVSKDKVKGKHQIYDGVNRWRFYHDAGNTSLTVPCILATCSNPKDLALTLLGVGRKRSTGQRIMAYLEQHRKEVLAAADETQEIRVSNLRKGHVTPSGKLGKNGNFTSQAIAEKLRVSDKDVKLGIELLRCIEEKTTASWNRGTLEVARQPLDLETDDGRDYLKAVKKVHLGLLAGSTPIRRWKPAVGGLAKTQDRPRPPIDHGMLACGALRTLINAVKHWDGISAGLKQRIATDWEELRELAKKVHLD